MRYDRVRVKTAARETLRRTQPKPWTVTFMYWFLTLDFAALCLLILLAAGWFSLSERESLSTFTLALTLPLIAVTALLLYLLHAGHTAYCARLAREGKAGPIDLFTGFLLASRVLLLDVLRLLLLALWALPGLGVVWLIQRLAPLSGQEPLTLLGAWGSWALFAAYLLNRALTYSLAPYAMLEEPRRSTWDSIQKSTRLMLGRKMDYLLLRLSFLGWVLLDAAIVAVTLLPGLLLQSTADQLPLLAGVVLPDWFFVPFLLVGAAAAAPLLLWLHSYRGVSLAWFYRTACAPPFPGITPIPPSPGGKRLIR